MMSELNTTLLTQPQLQAQYSFDKRFRWVSSLAFIGVAWIGLILILYSVLKGNGSLWSIGLLLCASAGIYPFVLLQIFRWRTGLSWHIINSPPSLFSASGYLLVLTLMIALVLGLFKSLLVILGLMLAGLGLVMQFVRVWLVEFSQQRAQVERQRYGDRWLKLGELSFRDIALIRIPHERA